MPMPKPRVRNGAIAAQVEVPLKGLARKIRLFHALHQQVVIRQALAAADDFAVAFGRQHVDAQGELRGVRGPGFI